MSRKALIELHAPTSDIGMEHVTATARGGSSPRNPAS